MRNLETGNDRFKRGFNRWFWISLTLATLLHAGLFFASPTFGIDGPRASGAVTVAIDIPERIDIPDPPPEVQRPARPVMTDAAVDEELTIPRTTFEDNPVDRLAPPPGGDRSDLEAAPQFTPFTVRPVLQNAGEVARALERHYPEVLREAGVGGTANVWFFLDADGRVLKTQLKESSGYDAFDDAALQVATLMRFSPAWNRDQRVPVWVSFNVTFQVQ